MQKLQSFTMQECILDVNLSHTPASSAYEIQGFLFTLLVDIMVSTMFFLADAI